MPFPKLIEHLKLLTKGELKAIQDRVSVEEGGGASKLLDILARFHPEYGKGVPSDDKIAAQMKVAVRSLENHSSQVVTAAKKWLAEQEMHRLPGLTEELYHKAVAARSPGSGLSQRTFAAYQKEIVQAGGDNKWMAWRKFELSYSELFAADMAGQDKFSELTRLERCVEKLKEAYCMAAVRLDIEAKIHGIVWSESGNEEIYFPAAYDGQSPFLMFQFSIRKALYQNAGAFEFQQLCKRYFELLEVMTVEERYFTAIHLGAKMAINQKGVEGDEWLKMLPDFYEKVAEEKVFKEMGLIDINMFLNVLAFMTAQGAFERAEKWLNEQCDLIPEQYRDDVKNISGMRLTKNLKDVEYKNVKGRKPNIAIRVYGHTILAMLAEESENALEVCKNFRKYLQAHKVATEMEAPYLVFLSYAEILAKRKPGTLKQAREAIKSETIISHKRSLVWLFDNLGK